MEVRPFDGEQKVVMAVLAERQRLAFEEIKTDYKFMLLEINRQIDRTLKVLSEQKDGLIDKIDERDDHIDNLKNSIEKKCYTFLHDFPDINRKTSGLVRSVNSIASNLERIGDFCNNIVSQSKFLNEMTYLQKFGYRKLFKKVRKGLDLMSKGLNFDRIETALDICALEEDLDDLYEKTLHAIIQELKKGENTEDLITTLFIFKYFERIGDALLNIGEFHINAIIGEKLKLEYYLDLEDLFKEFGINLTDKKVDFRPILDTRSGCQIGRIKYTVSDDQIEQAIFKSGQVKKIKDEKKSVEYWNELVPGLAPRILKYKESGDRGALLFECLIGQNLKEILLDDSKALVIPPVIEKFLEALEFVWNSTLLEKPANVSILRQINGRLDDVYSAHSDFKAPDLRIGQIKLSSLDTLLKQAEKIEDSLISPFQVRLHGDMNVDNIIFNSAENRIHYIDLHRSGHGDYVQDVSVFLVSNFRLTGLSEAGRKRSYWICEEMLKFARGFAQEHKDQTFEARLTLGLIRSFATSTRFQLSEKPAKALYQRAVYLLEKLIQFQGNYQNFKLPSDVLYYL